MVAAELCRRRPISKSANQSDYRGEFRASRIPTRRHRRNENTWREGKRQNTPRPPTRARTRSDLHARSRTHAHTRARPRFLWSDQWLEWLALDVEPKIPLGLPPRSPSSFRPFVVSVRARSGYLLRGRCGLNLINSMRHLDKCAPRTCIHRE